MADALRALPVLLALAGAVVVPERAWSQSFTLSGGADVRYTHDTNPSDDKTEIRGLFLNLRKVWSDELGDRWIGVAQADVDDNLKNVRPYQIYLQYKGPLGHCNLRGGLFLLPFGLLATYDTERLLLQGLEEQSLGIRKDSGLQVLGFAGRFDYAVAVTGGGGERRLSDRRADPVLTARVAYVKDDWQIGFSLLGGRPLPEAGSDTSSRPPRKRRLALDLTRLAGPLTVRAEAVAGDDEGRSVGGGVVLADLALGGAVELNSRFAVWRQDQTQRTAGVGVSYRLGRGFVIRVAHQRQINNGGPSESTLQFYYDFSRQI